MILQAEYKCPEQTVDAVAGYAFQNQALWRHSVSDCALQLLLNAVPRIVLLMTIFVIICELAHDKIYNRSFATSEDSD